MPRDILQDPKAMEAVDYLIRKGFTTADYLRAHEAHEAKRREENSAEHGDDCGCLACEVEAE